MCGRFASSSCGRHHGAGRHRRLTNDAATSAVAAAAATGRRTRLPSNHVARRTPHRTTYRTPSAAYIRRLSNMPPVVFRRTHHTRPETRQRILLSYTNALLDGTSLHAPIRFAPFVRWKPRNARLGRKTRVSLGIGQKYQTPLVITPWPLARGLLLYQPQTNGLTCQYLFFNYWYDVELRDNVTIAFRDR